MNRSAEGNEVAPYPDIAKDRIKDELSARRAHGYLAFGKAVQCRRMPLDAP